VSMPRSGNGRHKRRRSRASTITLLSWTSSATHSVRPVATSVSTKVWTKLPSRRLTAVRHEIRFNEPGGGLVPVGERANGDAPSNALRGFRPGPAPPVEARVPASMRSMVEALMANRRVRTLGSRCRCP
jgi:hypothetical protein